MRLFFVSLLCLSELYLIFSNVIPTELKCSVWDSPCLTAKAQDLTPVLVAGIPSLGSDKLDTMFIDFLHIDKNGYKADLRDIHVQGMKNSVIDDISIDMISKHARLLFHTDLKLNSQYITSGTMLTLPIYGQGDYLMDLNDVQIEMVMPFEIIKDAFGNDILELKSFKYAYDVRGGAGFLFKNLYNGDSHLSNIMHNAMLENWKQLTSQFGTSLFDLVNQKIFESIRKYLHSQPMGGFVLY